MNKKELKTSLRKLDKKQNRARIAFYKKYPDEPSIKLHCGLCGNRKFHQINSYDRWGYFYPSGICKNCGNLQQIYYYREDALNFFYSSIYSDLVGRHTKFESKEGYFKSNEKMGESILNFTKGNLKSNFKILDFGCGCGGALMPFLRRGHDCVGIDLDQENINLGKSYGLDIRLGSFEAVESEKFDLIILSNVLEHIVEPGSFLIDLKSLLTSEGMIFIDVPSMESLTCGAYGAKLKMYFQACHVTHFNLKTFKNFLSSSNYKSIKINQEIKALIKPIPTKNPINSSVKNKIKGNKLYTIFLIFKIKMFRAFTISKIAARKLIKYVVPKK